MFEELECRARWQDGAYFLTQKFRLRSPARCLDPMTAVQRIDALVNERTQAAGCGLLRWHGDALMLGRVCVLRLGALKPRLIPLTYEAAAEREILGGLMVHRPGGAIWYGVRSKDDGLILIAGLSNFLPRLPQPIFVLTQAPLHRATIRRAARHLAAERTA